ncbi:MAG: translation initiation factor IF-6 [Candidatus Methylarchaceae archaeon HK01B]|nr:translation initiation factor IF-6 [Candidatus Methylarchaceae archaeon HK01M]MCP8312656.1 translation initiation factor IF-6 [Candidatus Methylarchaceae archaeon HK02M1]MCP8318284.1 translation initiation factor IF-6 [Candidatus Methylarchaceae archaeon HK01B]
MFTKCNDNFLLIPKGLSKTKTSKFSAFLGVEPVETSISGLRLIGPLVAMNNNGLLVSRLAEDEEIREIKRQMGLPIERAPTKYTSIGNLMAVNDNGAIISEVLPKQVVKLVADVLDVPVDITNIANYHQVGSMVLATNMGGVIHPRASEDEVERVHKILKVHVAPSTVNSGVPYVSSGIIANSKNAIVGTSTSGPELAMLSRILKV